MSEPENLLSGKKLKTYEEIWLHGMKVAKFLLPHASLEELTELVDKSVSTMKSVDEER
jgi:hypothetical protein